LDIGYNIQNSDSNPQLFLPPFEEVQTHDHINDDDDNDHVDEVRMRL
jgi:hypothetical protein